MRGRRRTKTDDGVKISKRDGTRANTVNSAANIVMVHVKYESQVLWYVSWCYGCLKGEERVGEAERVDERKGETNEKN